MTVPGYHVLKEEEDLLRYSSNSPFENEEHVFRKELETRRIPSDEEEGGETNAEEDSDQGSSQEGESKDSKEEN